MEKTDFLQQLHNLLSHVPYGDTLYTLLIFLVVLAVLVFVHELGHYLAARSVGVTVQQFSIGFGKELAGWVDKAGTRWKICAIPLGGYVQMLGEGESQSQDETAFSEKSILQRAWVIFAGPLANFLFAALVMIVLMWSGEQRPMAKVGEVVPDMPAAIAGFVPDDVILMVDDEPIEDWQTFQNIVSKSAEKPLNIAVQRGEAILPLTLTPKAVEVTNLFGETHKLGRIGVVSNGELVTIQHGFVDGAVRGVTQTWHWISLTVKSIGKLFTGALGMDNLSGPIGIAKMAGDTAQNGWYALAMFLVIISINLGIVNLLPIPVLDGGQLVFLTVEAFLRRPLGEMAQEWFARIGLMFILALVMVSTFNDVKDTKAVTATVDFVKGQLPDNPAPEK